MIDLSGRHLLVTGVRNDQSIAWHTARRLWQAGATLSFSCYSEREARQVREMSGSYDPASHVFCCDATQESEIQSLREQLEEQGIESLHGLVHAMAFARKADLQEGVLGTTQDSFRLCLDTTAYTLVSLCGALRPLLTAAGDAAVLTYTFVGAERAVPHYNVVGVAKAALEAEVRYLAAELGPDGIRVNAVSAGPLRTLSSGGIPGFEEILQETETRSALRRNITVDEAASAACFLLSPAASGITGVILPVDAGFRVAF